MATKIVTKNSSTASAVPTASDLVQGELAVNVADKRLFTEDNAGAIVELGTNPSGNVTFQDNGKAIFGAGSDLQIYHSGSASFISDQGTGNLKVLAQDFAVNNPADTANMITAAVGGAVTAFYDGGVKLATTSTGIDVTGTASMDGGLIEGSTGLTIRNDAVGANEPKLVFDNDTFAGASHAQIQTGNGGLQLLIESPSTSTFQNRHQLLLNGGGSTDVTFKLSTDNGTSYKNQLQINNNDISFYEDTGTTAKFFWDASAESLGIGTSSPSVKLDVISSNQVVSNFAHPSTSTAAVNGGAIVRIQNTNATNGNQSSLIFADSTASASSGIFGYNTNHSTHEGYMVFGTRNSGGSFAERMRIFSTGQVAINNTVASSMDGGANNLVIGSGSGTEGMTIYSGTANSGTIYFADGSSGDDRFRGQINYAHSDNSLNFRTNASSAPNMTLDSAGNLLVGKTSSSYTTDGFEALAAGAIQVSDTSTNPVGVNRNGTDGSLISLFKSGASVGSIGAAGGDFTVNAQSVGVLQVGGASKYAWTGSIFYPTNDNTSDLGTSSFRFKDLYLSGTVALTTADNASAANMFVSPSTDFLYLEHPSNGMIFRNTAGSERMRIDASGNLLVGTTDTNPADNGAGGDAGHAIAGTGYIASSRSGDTVALFNRMDNDGDIVDFRKDGSIVGSIGVSGTNAYIDSQGGTLKISTVGTERYNFDLDQIYPSVDNDTNLGLSSKRFADLYLSGGVYLGGTGSANKLDDYEEGTWTPTLNSGTFSSYTATYTKVGRVVTIILDATVGTGGGSNITLPFTCTNTTGTGIYVSGQDFATGRTQMCWVAASSLLYFRTIGDNIVYSAQALTAGAIIHATLTYNAS